MDTDSDESTRDADDGFGEASIAYNGQETKSVELSTILSKHKHSSEGFLADLHKMLNMFLKADGTNYVHKLLEEHLQAGHITNPLWKMKSQGHFKQEPELGEYPKFLYKLNEVTENELHNFKIHLQNLLFYPGDTFGAMHLQTDLHRNAIEATSYSLSVSISSHKQASSVKGFASIISTSKVNKNKKVIGRHKRKNVLVPLKPVVLARFKDAIKLLDLDNTSLLKIVCKYTSPKFSPWANLASELWLRSGHVLQKLKKCCNQYAYMKMHMPKAKRRQHVFVLEAQQHVIHQLREECDCLKYFTYLCLSDFIVAGVLEERTKVELAKSESLEEGQDNLGEFSGVEASRSGVETYGKNDSVDTKMTKRKATMPPQIEDTFNTDSPVRKKEYIVEKADLKAVNLEERSVNTLMNL